MSIPDFESAASSNTQIQISWTALVDLQTGGSPILEYIVQFD